MKTCEDYQELVSAFIDGEAGDEETAGVFIHLGACAECRAFMTSVLRVQSALMMNDRSAADARPVKRSPVWKRRFAVPYPAAAAAAALVCLTGSLFFLQHAQPPAVVNTTHTAYVYVTSLPPVDVVASPLTEK